MALNIDDVSFYSYSTEDGGAPAGYTIEPQSDEKTVFIPSPPTTMVKKINPRPAVIYLSSVRIDENYTRLDELKAMCKEEKQVFVCPTATASEELKGTYDYIIANAKTLNIKPEEIIVMGDKASLDAAQSFVDYACDELDADIEDAELLEL